MAFPMFVLLHHLLVTNVCIESVLNNPRHGKKQSKESQRSQDSEDDRFGTDTGSTAPANECKDSDVEESGAILGDAGSTAPVSVGISYPSVSEKTTCTEDTSLYGKCTSPWGEKGITFNGQGLRVKIQVRELDTVPSVCSEKRQRTSSAASVAVSEKSTPKVDDILQLMRDDASFAAAFLAEFRPNSETAESSKSTSSPLLQRGPQNPDNDSTSDDRDDSENGGDDDNGDDGDIESSGGSDSGGDEPMTISEGLSLRKHKGRHVEREVKVKSYRTLFTFEGMDLRMIRRWKVMFAAIRYDYVAHGPPKPVASTTGQVYDDREYQDMFKSRYHIIFGSNAPPMTPVQVAAVPPCSQYFRIMIV